MSPKTVDRLVTTAAYTGILLLILTMIGIGLGSVWPGLYKVCLIMGTTGLAIGIGFPCMGIVYNFSK